MGKAEREVIGKGVGLRADLELAQIASCTRGDLRRPHVEKPRHDARQMPGEAEVAELHPSLLTRGARHGVGFTGLSSSPALRYADGEETR